MVVGSGVELRWALVVGGGVVRWASQKYVVALVIVLLSLWFGWFTVGHFAFKYAVDCL